MTKFNYSRILILFFLAFSLSSCLNVEQTTTIKEDGSGYMFLHYWTNKNFVEIGDIAMGDDIGGFSFISDEIKRKYTTETMEVLEMRRYNHDNDTTTHIEVIIKFMDFNKISESPGFATTTTSYIKGKDNTEFKYTIAKDTSIKLNYVTDKNTLEYIFVFPNEVVSTNGEIQPTVKDSTGKDAYPVKWKFLVSDHATKDFELNATIKNKFNLCGMFGIELPATLLIGLAYSNRRKFNKIFRKKNEKQNRNSGFRDRRKNSC